MVPLSMVVTGAFTPNLFDHLLGQIVGEEMLSFICVALDVLR